MFWVQLGILPSTATNCFTCNLFFPPPSTKHFPAYHSWLSLMFLSPSLHSVTLGSKFQKHASFLNSISPSAYMLPYSLLHSSISPTLNSSQIPKSLQSPIAFWFFLQIACLLWSFAFFTKDIDAFFKAWDDTVWVLGSLMNWISKKKNTAGLPDV